ncbi:MAG: DUF4384 domain-containing protein [Geminicoccaceae bacterium]
MTRSRSHWRAGLALGIAALSAACAYTPAEEAPIVAQPNRAPTRNVTGFTEALTCMDNLFTQYNKSNFVITSQGIPDATGEISTGTKEMLITAISRMSVKSGAFRFVDFDQVTSPDINSLQSLVGFTDDFRVPNFYLRGAVTQFDENVISEAASASVAIPDADVGVSADQVVSVVSLDLNAGDLLTRQILPGISSNNSIAVRRVGFGGDAGGEISTLGVFFSLSLNRSEGMHAAVRNLVELSAIEVLGKLTKVPYWRCLSIEQTNPQVMREARGWFNAMGKREQVAFVQDALIGLGYYQGQASGNLDAATREAIGAYQAQNDLIADGRVNFDLYAKLISEDLALGRKPSGNVVNAAVNNQAAATTGQASAPPPAPPSLAMVLSTPRGDQPVYNTGEVLQMTFRTNQDAYGYCYYQDASGQVARVFPNRFQPDALVPGGTVVTVPSNDASFEIVLEQPGVTERFLCVAADQELGLALPDGLKSDDLTPLPARDLDQIANVFRGLNQGQLATRQIEVQVR